MNLVLVLPGGIAVDVGIVSSLERGEMRGATAEGSMFDFKGNV